MKVENNDNEEVEVNENEENNVDNDENEEQNEEQKEEISNDKQPETKEEEILMGSGNIEIQQEGGSEEYNQEKEVKEKKNENTEKYNLKGTEVSANWIGDEENIHIAFKKNTISSRLILHLGLYKNYPIDKWFHPSRESYPRETKEFDDFALDTEFVDDGKESAIKLSLPKNAGQGISFVFYDPVDNTWYNNNLNDFQIQFSL